MTEWLQFSALPFLKKRVLSLELRPGTDYSTMKRTPWLATIFPLTLAALTVAGLTGCNKSEPTAAPPPASASQEEKKSTAAVVSAEKTSFKEVTSHLDAGGNMYIYLSTEQFLEGLSGKVSAWRQLAGSIPDLKQEHRENVGKAFDIVTHLIKDSGVEDISGFGMSSIAREKGLYHTKTLLHHYKGKGSGFLWTLFGQKPHALDGLALLTTNTALATFSDLDVPLLWSVIQNEVKQAGFPQAEELLNKAPEKFEGVTGLKWDKVLASLGGEFGFVLTLDDTKAVPIPLPGGEPLEIAEPGLMFIFKVKDDTIFNRIDEALQQTGQQVVKVDKPELKMRTVPIPLPLPIQLRPTVAVGGGYLFIATTDALIQDALAVKAGQKAGLKSTDEFRRLAQDTPQQGNAFSFVSQRLGKTLSKIQQQALQMAAQGKPEQAELLKSFLSSTNSVIAYNVSANTEEGWSGVGNGNQHPAKLLAAAAIVPAAVLSAMALPAIAKARKAAEQKAP